MKVIRGCSKYVCIGEKKKKKNSKNLNLSFTTPNKWKESKDVNVYDKNGELEIKEIFENYERS